MFCKSFAFVDICVASERCFRVGYFSIVNELRDLSLFIFQIENISYTFSRQEVFERLGSKLRFYFSHKDVGTSDPWLIHVFEVFIFSRRISSTTLSRYCVKKGDSPS